MESIRKTCEICKRRSRKVRVAGVNKCKLPDGRRGWLPNRWVCDHCYAHSARVVR